MYTYDDMWATARTIGEAFFVDDESVFVEMVSVPDHCVGDVIYRVAREAVAYRDRCEAEDAEYYASAVAEDAEAYAESAAAAPPAHAKS